MPSTMPARSQLSDNIASSAAPTSTTPSPHKQHEYFSRGPRNSSKNSAGSS
jgi:hypothetical protein